MTVSKGKKIQQFKGGKAITDDALDAMVGSTGNLRAPAVVVGKTLLVGFNEEVYGGVFS